MTAVTAPRPTEAQCQATIVEAARRLGWFCHAERPAMSRSGKFSVPIQGDPGFPDLVLVHPTKRLLWFVELKRKPYQVASVQREWLDALEAVDCWHGHTQALVVWVPEEMDEFIADLGAVR